MQNNEVGLILDITYMFNSKWITGINETAQTESPLAENKSIYDLGLDRYLLDMIPKTKIPRKKNLVLFKLKSFM